MKDKQKVFIQGNPERGDEVIKTLEKLGGKNIHYLSGDRDDTYYYINPAGAIAITCIVGGILCPFLKEFYKEIKLPKKWKPEYKERYYYVNSVGIVMNCIWFNLDGDTLLYEFGNCFKTKDEAEAMKDKIKEILKQMNNEQNKEKK